MGSTCSGMGGLPDGRRPSAALRDLTWAWTSRILFASSFFIMLPKRKTRSQVRSQYGNETDSASGVNCSTRWSSVEHFFEVPQLHCPPGRKIFLALGCVTLIAGMLLRYRAAGTGPVPIMRPAPTPSMSKLGAPFDFALPAVARSVFRDAFLLSSCHISHL